MSQEGEKRYYRGLLNKVKNKVSRLSQRSYLQNVFDSNIKEQVESQIKTKQKNDLQFDRYPPLFCFLGRSSLPQIKELDFALHTVVKNSKDRDRGSSLRFLSATADELRLWQSGLFEIYIKSAILKKWKTEVILDPLLENRKKPDLNIQIGNKNFTIESTVLTDRDDAISSWVQHLEEKKENPGTILMECGNSAYSTLRLYAKVYDKLAPKLNPEKCQLSNEHPNILMISLVMREPNMITMPGIGWGLDELFAEQSNPLRNEKRLNTGLDISLSGWLRYHENEKEKQKKNNEGGFY